VGHVAIAGNDLEALDRFVVADNVVQEDGAVLLDPEAWLADTSE